MSRFESIKEDRIGKLEALKKLGVNPFPGDRFERESVESAKIKDGQLVKVAGRIMAKRGHGKLIFVDLVDASEKIQLMLKADILSEEIWKLVELLDTGDFVGVE